VPAVRTSRAGVTNPAREVLPCSLQTGAAAWDGLRAGVLARLASCSRGPSQGYWLPSQRPLLARPVLNANRLWVGAGLRSTGIMNSELYLQLREVVVLREGRSLVLAVPGWGSERIVLADPTGSVELLLELLTTGPRTRADIVCEFTSKREGAEAPAVAAALDGLEQLGLIIASRSGRAQTKRGSPVVRAGDEALAVWGSPTGLPYSGRFGAPDSGLRP
jgi:hypothetical protein